MIIKRVFCCSIFTLMILLGNNLVANAAAGKKVAVDGADLALVGGQLIDGYGGSPVPNSVILIKGNRIIAVGDEKSLTLTKGIKIIDTNGMSVLPGLIDVHVHFDILGHSDYSHWFSVNNKERLQKEVMPASAKILLHAGVTSARDLGADPDAILWLREQINKGQLEGPRAFVAGPYLVKARADYIVGAYDDTWEISDAKDIRKKVREAVKLGVDVIKTKVSGLSKDELKALYSEARKNKIPVAIHLFE